jgi:hypothetical protein
MQHLVALMVDGKVDLGIPMVRAPTSMSKRVALAIVTGVMS